MLFFNLKVWDLELLPVLAANPIKYSSLFLRINLKSWRYTPNLGCISTCHLTGNSIDRPKYITFCHSIYIESLDRSLGRSLVLGALKWELCAYIVFLGRWVLGSPRGLAVVEALESLEHNYICNPVPTYRRPWHSNRIPLKPIDTGTSLCAMERVPETPIGSSR